MKKTIHIETLVDMANQVLQESPDGNVRGRETLCCFIENIMQKTGNYRGFSYLTKEEMKGKSYGIDGTSYPSCFAGTDNTRRQYFIKRG